MHKLTRIYPDGKVDPTSTSGTRYRQIDEMQPGEMLAYTDGDGKYYGTVARPCSGEGLVFDHKGAKALMKAS